MTTGSIDRRAGMLMPLFSMPSSRSWGIGEICDLEPMTVWLADSGHRLLQLLPITETSPEDPSPYGSISAMAKAFATCWNECAPLARLTTEPSAS